VLTLFTIPKPFRGHIGDIQRNAIESWRALRPEVQIVLVGDEEGVEAAARSAGVEHVDRLARNERGTPRLDSAFEGVEAVARHPLWCLVNADIVLLDDFPAAVAQVAGRYVSFLMVGESRDLSLAAGAPLGESAYRDELRRWALADGRLRGYAALDYFVFPRGHFSPLPPFLIGRACFDNWLVWRARQRGPVVDATRRVVSVHQSHDYSHMAGGLEETYYGEEAKYNERLAGGRAYIYSLHDATHRMTRSGAIYRYWGSTLRARENLRKARVHAEVRIQARRRAGRESAIRIVGVFPEPTPYRNPLLDAVARIDGLELSVLYTACSVAGRTWSPPAPEHKHWIMRSVRAPGARQGAELELPTRHCGSRRVAPCERQRLSCKFVSVAWRLI